jgi:hypothetical protein
VGDDEDQTGSEPLQGWRIPAAFAIVVAALMLMTLPASIAGVAVLDSRLTNRIQDWLRWPIGLSPYLDLGRFGSTLVLAVIVARASEDQ